MSNGLQNVHIKGSEMIPSTCVLAMLHHLTKTSHGQVFPNGTNPFDTSLSPDHACPNGFL